MKTQIELGATLTVPLLQALLMDQQAEGDAEGAAKTRRMIDKLTERERLRHQALRAGRWPFTVTGPKPGGDHDR
jgi:hypothetical protein